MAKIEIFRTQLTPARNALLDNVENYLEAIRNKTDAYTGDDERTYISNDFQFVKPDIDIKIKIALDIKNNNMFESIGNYLRIEQYQENKSTSTRGTVSVWYYFIIASKWISQGTIELTCSMDTVNTFKDFLLDGDNWDEKTNILREHVKNVDYLDWSPIYGNLPGYYVDKYSEDFEPNVLIKTQDQIIEEPNSLGIKEWYLVYKTDNAATDSEASSNKMKCYLYPSENIIYSKTAGSPSQSFVLNSYTNNLTYGIVNGGVTFTTTSATWLSSTPVSTGYNTVYKHVAFYNGGTQVYSNTGDTFPAIEGYAYINNSFSLGGVTYRCDRVVWNKAYSRLGIPVGIFKNGDTEIQGFYMTSFNGITINKYVILRTKANITYISARQVRTDYYRILSSIDNLQGDQTYEYLTSDTDGLSASGINYTFSSSVQTINDIELTQNFPTAVTIGNGTIFYANGGSPAATKIIQSISELDRTDATLVKIIALPYCPTPISIGSGSVESGTYTMSFDPSIVDIENTPVTVSPERWRLYYKDLSKSFGKYIDNITLDFSYTTDIKTFFGTGTLQQKSILNEPKLQNSLFTKYKLVYDNVNKLIRYEDINPEDINITLKTYYMPTNTIDSKILFKWDLENNTYDEIYDWDKVLVSVRDNELPIYNNDYLNYIRYGYKTEKANLEATADAQRLSANTNAALSTGGATLSGALLGAKLGAAAGGIGAIPGAIIGGLVGLAAGLAQSSSALNAANTTIANAERTMSQKLLELQNTASTVINGNSAIDLMTEYSGNRLHFMKYELPPLLKESLYDKFFYCGYSHPIQDKPELRNRVIFNFVQCNPLFVNEATNIYAYYLADIKDRFNTGVTVYHDINGLLEVQDHSQLYTDWKQQYENWYRIDNTVRYSSSAISNLTIDDQGSMGCRLNSSKSIRACDYVEMQYFRDGTEPDQDEPEVEGRKYGPIGSGTHIVSIAIEPGQYQYSGSILRARIVDSINPEYTTDWVTTVL